MTPYRAIPKDERKKLRHELERQFGEHGYWFGVGSIGEWYATPIAGGQDIKFKDIFEAKKFIEDKKCDSNN